MLLYESRKIDPIIWDISTEEKLNKAFLALFNFLNDWGMYCNMQDDDAIQDPNDNDQRELVFLKNLYAKAREGDAEAAESFLSYRNNHHYEYEYFSIVRIEE